MGRVKRNTVRDDVASPYQFAGTATDRTPKQHKAKLRKAQRDPWRHLSLATRLHQTTDGEDGR